MSSVERAGNGAIVFNPDVGDFVRIGSVLSRIDTLQKVINEAESLKTDDTKRRGEVSEEFRSKPQNRRWEGSYTKTVHDAIGGIQAKAYGDLEALVRAYELLKDYHDTQHVIYEERDAARLEQQRLNDQIRKQTAELTETRTLAHRFAAKLQQLKAHLIEVGRTPS